MDHEPIFIVGCPRSGTTLLQCMLEAHPEIAIPQETSFLNLSRFHLLQRKRDPEKISHKEFEQMFLQSRHFARLNIPIQHVQDELASIPDPKWHSVWIATLRAYQKKRGKKYIGEKTPHHILHIEEIFRIFPQSKVLLLIRENRFFSKIYRRLFHAMAHTKCFRFALQSDLSSKYFPHKI
jgi:hypothetical protein